MAVATSGATELELKRSGVVEYVDATVTVIDEGAATDEGAAPAEAKSGRRSSSADSETDRDSAEANLSNTAEESDAGEGPESADTGDETVVKDSVDGEGTGGRGSVLSNSLESSNVDIAEEFTALIVHQRGYQSNSRIITTTDQLLQEALNLKR